MNQTINNLRQGQWETYYSNGKLSDKGSYLIGETHGYWEFYWQNGNPQWRGYYYKGSLIGFWLGYNFKGELQDKEFFL